MQLPKLYIAKCYEYLLSEMAVADSLGVLICAGAIVKQRVA